MNSKRITFLVAATSVFLMLFLIAGIRDAAYAGISGSGTSDSPYNINTGDLSIDADKGGEYYVTGSTDKYRIRIKGKDQDKVKEIKLHLKNVSINLKKDDVEEGAITLEEHSNVTIYVDSNTTNTLVGGNEHGAGRNNGHAGIQVDEGAKLNLDVWGNLEVTGGDGGSDRGAAGIGSRDNADCCGEISVRMRDNGSLKTTGKYGGAGIGGGNNSGTKDINITLDGQGRLEASGTEGGAGIGGGDDGSIPKINIKGNSNQTYLKAVGGSGAAGIGGGCDGEVTSVTIDGIGTLIGIGGYKAAGIGAGDHDSTGPGGNFGDLTIKNCGSVEATGGEAGAGIGGSEDSDVGDITVENCGTVEATGGSDASGIGSGRNSNGGKQVDIGDITIKNCQVNAVSKADSDGDGDGAGIGGGKASNVNSITITAEKDITAIGAGQGAGIGGGDDGKCGNISITNIRGKLKATAGDECSAGIGACDADCGNITLKLEGGTIDATGGHNGAGIGGGDGGDCGNIAISGWGTIHANSGFDAAAIGGGEGEDSGAITINGDSAHSKEHYDDDGDFALTINAAAYQEEKAIHSHLAPIIGSKKCGNISIEHANITLTYPIAAAMHGASIGCGKNGSLDTITIRHSRIVQSNININHNLVDYNIYGAMVGEGYGGDVNRIELDDVEYYGRTLGGAVWHGGDIESIKITDSRVHADAPDTTITMVDPLFKMRSADPIAGIGSGKDASIDSIEITGSEIEAYGKNGGAGIGSGGLYCGGTNLDNIFKTGGKCGSIKIADSKVYAWSQVGGAGIGGGAMTSVTKDITITKSNVDASVGTTDYWKIGGAGIGGGECAGCKGIVIKNSTVKAQGGPGSAGIGGGGTTQKNIVQGLLQLGWDPEIGNIEITGCEVTANGGASGAGIGSGQGVQLTDGCHIWVKNSTVNANGGDCGAGIGGGDDAEFNRGGDTGNIQILGKSKVIAHGGKEAAGVGGGSQGELDGCLIDLDSDPSYYLKAYGGAAGAGIGSGASHCTNSLITQNYGYLAKNIEIRSGWVYASGGGDTQIVDSMNGEHYQWIGAGAGIGGGAKGGLHGLTIKGGVIKARCQGSNGIVGLDVRQANQIGYGGGETEFLYRKTGCEGFLITGGTIDGDLCNEVDVKITGGNILQKLGGDKPTETRAKNDKDPVFRNTLTLDVSKIKDDPVNFEGTDFYPVTVGNVSTSYGTADIYGKGTSDTRAQIGLYLPASGKDAAHATVSGFKNDYYDGSPQYYGTTNKNDNTNILRIGSKIKLEPETAGALPAAESPFKLLVLPAEGRGMPEGVGYEYTASGASEPKITGQSGEGEAPFVTVTPAKAGLLKVTAKGNGTADDIYWSASEADYEAQVQPGQVKLRIEKDLNKLYDGKPDTLSVWAASDQDPSATPDILVDPEGARGENGRNLTVKYQNVDLPGMIVHQPEEPGNYSATVVCADPDNETGQITVDGISYAPGTAAQNFTISKYTQAFAVTAPEEVVYVKAGEKAQITPEWTLEVTDKNEDGTPVVPARAYLKGSAIGADKGYVTVKYRNMDDPEQKLTSEPPTDPGHYQMVLDACETTHYNAANEVYDFAIAEKADTQIQIEAEDKIYDGEPVAEPKITTNRNPDEVKLAYYRVDGQEETLLDDAPVDAGSYKVVATAEDSKTCNGGSAEAAFEIQKRPVTLSISGKSYGDTGAEIRVEVGNGLSDLAGTKLALTVNGTGTEAEISLEDGKPIAIKQYASVLPGEYTVQADFNADGQNGNYEAASETVTLKKNGGPFNVQADSMELVRGEEPKELQVTVSDYTGTTFDPAELTVNYKSLDTGIATIDEEGMVTPVKPGVCKVEVTVAGDDLHTEGKGTALITVHKSSFTPTIVVEDKEYDGKPIDIQVTDIPDDYVGLEDHPILFYYEKRGGEYVKIGDSDYDKVEIRDAGDYAVIVDCTRDANYTYGWNYATFKITPKGLNVHTGSAEKMYDGKPLTCEEAEVTGFVDGESAVITADGSQTEVGSSRNTWQITWAENDPEQTAKARNYAVREEDLGTLTVTDPAKGPFHIKTYQDLEEMAKNISENPVVYAGAEYIVDNNIKAPADSSWTLGIGSVDKEIPFTGSLEGNGFCIAGLNINMPGYGGLFEWIGTGGQVSNLYLFDCDFQAGSTVGGGIAAVNEGTISHCVNGVNLSNGVYISPVDGSLIQMEEFNSVISGCTVGGIAGINRMGGTIFGCRSVAEMTGTDDNGAVGGIAGQNSGTIDNCAGNNTIAASGRARGASFGGICGENYGQIAGGYSSASVSGAESAFSGNVVGSGTDGSLADIYFTTSEDQRYQGGGTNKEEQGVIGLMRSEMMKDDFLDQLKGTSSNKVGWIRSDGLNAGLPRIENPSTAFAEMTLSSGNVRLTAQLHRGAKLRTTSLNVMSDAWKLLAPAAGKRQVISATGLGLTDGAGNLIPAEIWSQSGAQITVPVSRKDVCFVLLDESGKAKLTEADEILRDGDHYLARVRIGGASAYMVVTKAETKPSEADTKPSEADTKPSEADTKPSEADTKPSKADTKPSKDKAKDEAKAKKVKTITVNVATVNAKALAKAVKKAGGSAKYVTGFTLGKKVKKINAKAFAKYKKVKTLVVKTKKLKKKSVKNSLRGSKVTTIKVKVGGKKVNKKYVKKYKKIFTKKNAGRKAKVAL